MMHSISSFQDIHLVDIPDSQTLNDTSNMPSVASDLNEKLPQCNVFSSCFHWVCKALWWFIKTVVYRICLFLVMLVLYPFGMIFLILGIVFLLWFIGTLSSVTFPFLLATWLVLRFSQFVKRGEDYDKVTQVKMFVEWYMFVNTVLLVFAIAEFGTNSKENDLEHVTIIGKPLLHWGDLIFFKILRLFGVRFILFWVIFKYMPRMTLEHNESGLKVIQTTCDIVDCLLFWYSGIVLITSVPKREFHGLPIRKWFEVPIFIVIGWNIIALLTHLIAWSIHKLVSWYLNHVHDDNERSHRYLLLEKLLSVHCLVYYCNGMKRSFNFMLSSLLLLIVWVFYFLSHLTKTEDSKIKAVTDFGTWTCIVLMISSFLWMLKDFVLLLWEANAVYIRLSAKILEARKSLYFLGIVGRHCQDILKLRYAEVGHISTENGAQIFMAKNLARVDAYYRDKMDEDDNDEMEPVEGIPEENRSQVMCKLSRKKRARVKRDLLLPKDDTMTLFDIQQVAQYFRTAADELYEFKTSDVVRKLKPHDNREILQNVIDGKNIAAEVVENLPESAQSSPESAQDSQDWSYFECLLKLDSSTYVSRNTVKAWLEKSHNNCLFLANTLRSAKEVVDCLNNIISILLICASLILWLLVTGLAHQQAFILIASPLLAATFMFGDTCKTLFQGIIFVYVVHPFHVGDLCDIDGRMIEVKSVGVWKTIFSNFEKVGTREEVIYPNSELAKKTVINHKTEFDWNDSVEFDVGHLERKQIEELKVRIECLLEEDESMCDLHNVAVVSSSEDTKMIVRFKHNKYHEGMTNYECVKEKDNLRTAFILDIQELVDKEGGR